MSLLDSKLEAFIAIVRHGTVHAAAENLHLTQTAVTQRIKALETRLRTTLFVRSRRGMELTREGEALLRYCQASKELEGEALAAIQGSGQDIEIELSISGPTSLMRSRIIPECIDVLKHFPKLLLNFNVNDSETRHQELRSGKIDFAILLEEHAAEEMQTKTLKPEEYICVCSSEWKKQTFEDIIKNQRIIDFDPTDNMTFAYLKQFNLFEHANHNRHFINRPESMADMIAAGLGYGVLTQEFAKPFIDSGQLHVLNDSQSLSVQHVLAWFERPEPPKYFKAVIDTIC